MISYLKQNRSEIGGRLFFVYRWALFGWLVSIPLTLAYALITGDYHRSQQVVFWSLWVVFAQWLLTGNKSFVPWHEWQVDAAKEG